MCGIAGLLGSPDRLVVERMIEAMRLRGPDDSGSFADDLVVLGHTRLSVIDLSPAAHQPMSRADGRLWIVYNGEIYNFRELRQELEARGQRFRSRSDTEVILALYETFGTQCVSRLRGMFAFAIWDRRTQDPFLFLARDHFGIKPLVYVARPGAFLFASDVPTTLRSGRVEANVDRLALVQYLMHGHVVQPRTILEDVRMLPAGHAMTVRPGREPSVWRYWDLEHARCRSLSAEIGLEEQAERVRALLENAARAQMVSDVPLGAFLSGGVDSCTLVALMTRVANRPIHTFSVGFAGEGLREDESLDAQRSAEHLRSVHRNVPVTGVDLAAALPDIAIRLGQPTVDGVNMYFVSEAARRGVTVALAGMGGDEIFAGYPSFSGLQRFWGPEGDARHFLGPWLGRTGFWRILPPSALRARWEMRSLRRDVSSHYMVWHMIRPPSESMRIAGVAVDPGELFAYSREDDAGVPDTVSRVSRLETKLYMTSQLLRDADAASMAHSLEVRVPFLDVDLVEFAYGLPAESKLGPLFDGGPVTGKRVLVRAVRDLIPEWTYLKPKRGFTMPFGEWLRGPLRSLAEDALADRTFRSAGLVDGRAIDRIWKRFLTTETLHWSSVWSVLMLALWWRGLRMIATSAGYGGAQQELRSVHR